MADLAVLRWIVETDFADIVMGTRIVDAKLRVLITDGSYLDFWWSLEIPGRFAHHWERSHVDGTFTFMTACRTVDGQTSSLSPSTTMRAVRIM